MADVEEKQEKGTTLMFSGLAVWVAGLLVLFFLPSAFPYGHKGTFAVILAALGIVGAVLMGRGWVIRRGSSE